MRRFSKAAVAQILIGILALGTWSTPHQTYAESAPPPSAELRPVAELAEKDGVARAPSPAGVSRGTNARLSAQSLPPDVPIVGLATDSLQTSQATPVPKAAVSGPSILRSRSAPRPEPGIQRRPFDKSGMLTRSVQPPRSPFSVAKHFPNEHAPPGLTVAPEAAPNEPEYVDIEFKQGGG